MLSILSNFCHTIFRPLHTMERGEVNKPKRRALAFVVCLLLLAACDSLSPTPPTLTPTREFSAPTLAPTPFFRFEPPTEVPPDTRYIGQNNPAAAGVPADSEIPPIVVDSGELSIGFRTVQITIREGVLAAGDIYQSAPVQTEQGMVSPHLPGVILIGASRAEWGAFPGAVRDAGYTVLVVEAYDTMNSQDVSTIMQAFSAMSSVNPGLIALIGSRDGADLALIGCAVDLICDAAVLLSPVGTITLTNVMPNYNPRPLFVAASTEDTAGFNTMQELQAATTGDFALQPYNNAGRGVEMLASQSDLTGIIIQWLQTHLSP